MSAKRQRLGRKERKANLLLSALIAAERIGIYNVNHREVAEEYRKQFGQCSVATVFDYFNTPKDLQKAIVDEVVSFRCNVPLLALEAYVISIRNSYSVSERFYYALDDNLTFAQNHFNGSNLVLDGDLS